MAEFKYRFCIYCDNLLRQPMKWHRFAVVVASKDQLSLYGKNLSAMGFTAKHPLSTAIYKNTLDVVQRSIDVNAEPLTALEALTPGPVNLSYSGIETCHGEDILVVARQLMAPIMVVEEPSK